MRKQKKKIKQETSLKSISSEEPKKNEKKEKSFFFIHKLEINDF
jgi:hypothetical protein